MTKQLSEALWRRVNDALDAGRSPWDDERVIDWLAEHPQEFAPLERALERVHVGGARARIVASARPRRATLAAAAGFALAALVTLAGRLAPRRADPLPTPPGALTVHAFEIQVDRGTPRGSSLDTTGPFAHVDVRVETLTHRNPRR